MIFEKKEQYAVVREGYQILLRAESEMIIPKGKDRICTFYTNMARTCMSWAEQIEGERLRSAFLKLESPREKAQFQSLRYRLSSSIPWMDEAYMAVLCTSTFTGQWKIPDQRVFKISHVWSLEDELLVPIPQILELFEIKLGKKQLPFRADGVYPQGDYMVFFRNATEKNRFLEERILRKK